MRASCQRHEEAVLWGVPAPAAAWCLWWSGPVDIRSLMGDRETGHIGAVVWPQSDLPHAIQEDFGSTAGTPEAEGSTDRLEGLRFRRSAALPLPQPGKGPGAGGLALGNEPGNQ